MELKRSVSHRNQILSSVAEYVCLLQKASIMFYFGLRNYELSARGVTLFGLSGFSIDGSIIPRRPWITEMDSIWRFNSVFNVPAHQSFMLVVWRTMFPIGRFALERTLFISIFFVNSLYRNHIRYAQFALYHLYFLGYHWTEPMRGFRRTTPPGLSYSCNVQTFRRDGAVSRPYRPTTTYQLFAILGTERALGNVIWNP